MTTPPPVSASLRKMVTVVVAGILMTGLLAGCDDTVPAIGFGGSPTPTAAAPIPSASPTAVATPTASPTPILTPTPDMPTAEPTAAPTPKPTVAPAEPGERVPFPVGGKADYQLGGAYSPPAGVTVLVRDSTAEPADGVFNVCYVNGFQTQPGETFPLDLVVKGPNGKPLVDPNWPDENIIDISTAAKRSAAAQLRFVDIDRCAASGFDSIEFDNLDSYTRSKNVVTIEDALSFATALTGHAHQKDLSVAQKNTAELGTLGRDEAGFDFAIVEECDQFDECVDFAAVYGDAVMDIEYTDDLKRPFAEVCADPATPKTTILRDRDLVIKGKPEYVYESC